MKTIVFDFNGTIIDDLDLCLNILNDMLTKEGKKTVSKRKYKEIFRFPIVDYYKLAGFDFKRKSFEELSVDFIEAYQKPSLNCKLQKGFLKTLKMFKGKGYNLVVLSASQRDNLIEQLEHFKIDKYFDAILGIDNIYAKSKIEIGKKYFLDNKIDTKNTYMIGDTTHDYEVSKALNINSILISKGHESKRRLSLNDAYVCDSFKEAYEYIESR